ncbi:hypothetical protein Tco_0571266 [Tanacetum coccineum]
MSEDIWYAGSDTRPPMLDKTDFESWQQTHSCVLLGKDNERGAIMKSITEGTFSNGITEGPFKMGTFIQTPAEETEGALQLGPKRARVFTDLSAEEKERYKADIRATNILLQGIPKDIYTIINHYTDAEDIWDNMKMILEGSELTKDNRESQLYDEFDERFSQIKGKTIHEYYRFITEVKLNRGLKESNFDQLYAYLKQHEVHANENRMMMERFIQPTDDPLALVSNASNQKYPTQSSESPQFSNQPSLVDNCQMDTGSTSTDNLIESLTNTLALLNQSFKAHLPQINNQLRTSSNARNKATVQDDRVVVQDVRDRYNVNNQGRPFQRNNARGNVVAGNVGGQNRVGNMNPGQAKPIMCYNCKGIGHIAREFQANHARPVVHDSEDTRDMAEITRKRMMEKMQSPQYNNDRKKAETSVPKPLSALTVYPPNTPVKLVPRVLPTKSQVKINLYVLTQLFTEFDKTCKKRITPTGVTEGERGVQTALFKEVKVMEEIFDQMSDEVDQNVVDKQCAEIVKKNLLIENENLIANCLSNQLLFDVEKSRCLDLEAEMSKSQNEIKPEIQNLKGKTLNFAIEVSTPTRKFMTITNHKLLRRVELEEVKQHYKELFESIQITRASTNEKTSSLLTQIEDLKAQLEGNMKVAARSSVKTKVLAPGMYAIMLDPNPLHAIQTIRNAHLTYINHLKESVETVREIVEEARVVKPLDNVLNYACQYTKLSQELVEYVIGTCPKEFTERDSKAPSIPLTRKKQVTFTDTWHSVNATPTVKIVLNKGKQIWKPKGKLSDNSLNKTKQIWQPKGKLFDNSLKKTKQVWKATGKLFANVGYQWRPTGKKFTSGKLNCGYQWRPTGKKFALGEYGPMKLGYL